MSVTLSFRVALPFCNSRKSYATISKICSSQNEWQRLHSAYLTFQFTDRDKLKLVLIRIHVNQYFQYLKKYSCKLNPASLFFHLQFFYVTISQHFTVNFTDFYYSVPANHWSLVRKNKTNGHASIYFETSNPEPLGSTVASTEPVWLCP